MCKIKKNVKCFTSYIITEHFLGTSAFLKPEHAGVTKADQGIGFYGIHSVMGDVGHEEEKILKHKVP